MSVLHTCVFKFASDYSNVQVDYKKIFKVLKVDVDGKNSRRFFLLLWCLKGAI